MQTRIAVAAAAVLLASCQGMSTMSGGSNGTSLTFGEGEDARTLRPLAVDGEVKISVRGSNPNQRLVVDVEPATPVNDDTPNWTKIKFLLESGYKFTDNGIELCPSPSALKVACLSLPDSGSDRPCKRKSDTVYTCRYRTPPTNTVYYYTIRVRNAAGTLIVLDPSLWN